MKKSFIYVFAVSFVAIGSLFACSEMQEEEGTPVNGYSISIPVQSASTKAVADNGTASFKTSENVYIKNITRNALETTVLHPDSNDTKTHFTTGSTDFLTKTYFKDDFLMVLYNTNSDGTVDYSSQDGSIDNVIDAGTGTVTITDISDDNITTDGATLDNLQSIFKFTFKYNNAEISRIRFVRIFSTKNKLAVQYNAITGDPTYGPVTVSRSTSLANNYIYAGLRFDANDGDDIVFQVVDENGKVYSGSKTAPSGGFKIGKYYDTIVDVNLYTFTVASGTVVYFAPGNLGMDGSSYSFINPFENWGQFEGNAPSLSKRAYFNWNEVSASYTINGISSWRILTQAEWDYLLNTRTMTNSAQGVQRYYRIRDNYNSYNGLLLPPDNATSDDVAGLTSGSLTSNVDYKTYIKKGFAFLHYTGYWCNNAWRYPEYPNPASSNRGRCYYWSSQKNSSNGYCLTVNDSKVDPTDYWSKETYYLSVRLVHVL